MKLFIIADIHGALKPFDRAERLIRNCDAVCIAGDITRRGSPDDAVAVFDRLMSMTTRIIAVPGNWDGRRPTEILQQNGYNIHGSGIIMGDIGFFGCGGGLRSFIRTPLMFTEEEISDCLAESYTHIEGARVKILITHMPPHGLRDRTLIRTHAGSRSVREFIAAHKIDAVICGHIHEAAGIERSDFTVVVNPGSFKKGKYAVIDISDRVEVTAGKI